MKTIGIVCVAAFTTCGEGSPPVCWLFGSLFEKAVRCLIKDREVLGREIVEGEQRHRTVRAKGFLSNKTALAMIFKLAEAAGGVSTVITSYGNSSRK